MDTLRYIELALLGLFSFLGWWVKSEHKKIVDSIDEVKDDNGKMATQIAVIDQQVKSNQSYFDTRLEKIEIKVDKIYEILTKK